MNIFGPECDCPNCTTKKSIQGFGPEDAEVKLPLQCCSHGVFTSTHLISFIEKINLLDDCWEWMGVKSLQGYGHVNIHKTTHQAHRISYMLSRRITTFLPRCLYVCHTCDNPSCVRPDHLFLGTNSDNQLDRRAKGRISGESRPSNRKLTVSQVASIRSEYLHERTPQSKIARHYGVAQSQISRIVNGIQRIRFEQ